MHLHAARNVSSASHSILAGVAGGVGGIFAEMGHPLVHIGAMMLIAGGTALATGFCYAIGAAGASYLIGRWKGRGQD
jgi:hypothetical protein